jgi:hypothetical protein
MRASENVKHNPAAASQVNRGSWRRRGYHQGAGNTSPRGFMSWGSWSAGKNTRPLDLLLGRQTGAVTLSVRKGSP